jgi:hypothetical protein
MEKLLNMEWLSCTNLTLVVDMYPLP